MSIFNRNYNKNYNKNFFRKTLGRVKKRIIVVNTLHRVTVSRVMSICLLGAVVTGGSLMGISAIIPEDMDISEDSQADMVSVDNALKTSAAAITSGGALGSETGTDTGTDNRNAYDEAADSSGIIVDGKAAVLMEAVSGKVLFSQNGADRLPPASVTKVMTMLLAMEAIDRGQVSLTDKVSISERAASMGGSQMYMEPGEQHTLEELMKGISMVSANDACVAVAEYLAGSVEIFVENMNTRAKELGMENTHFVNTNGLPVSDHYTSAHDIAVMSCELIKHKKTREWFTNWQDTLTVGLPGKQTEFGLNNTNKLIKQYNGANGIKTGFTQEAGYCLSGSATRDDMTLVAVVLGCPSSKVRFAEAAKLLDYGFATYDTVMLAEKGESNGMIAVEKGYPDFVNVVAGEDISILVKKGEKESITFQVEQSSNIKAPIAKDERVGDIVVYQNEKEIARYPLVADEASEKATWIQLYKRFIKNLIK